MAALDFPSSPSLNQVYTANGYSWKWNGVSWISLPTITGGSINDTTIGATTPSTGAFTTLSASGQLTVTGAAQNAFGSSFTPTAWGVSSVDINHASGGLLALYYGGSPKGYLIALSGGGISVNTQGAGTLDFNVNGTQRAQISSTGLAVTGTLTATNSGTAAANMEVGRLAFTFSNTAGYGGALNWATTGGTLINRIAAESQNTGNNVDMVFSTYSSNTLSERMRLSGVGILTVQSASNQTAAFKSSGNYSYLRLQHTGTGACTWDLYTGVGSGTTTFGIADSGGTRMAINSSGNIALCMATPINLTNANVVTIGDGSTSVNRVGVLYLRSGNGAGGSRDFSWEGDGAGSIVLKDRGYNGGNNGTGAIIGIPYSGSIRFYTYGAGTLVTDASGNITASSDARMKDVLGNFDRGLAAICGITPKLFKWNAESGLDREQVNAGFVAQDVLPHIPEAIHEKDGRYSMSDRPLIAALVNAVKELSARVAALEGAAKA